jgi:hypothetical protein
MNLNYRFWLAEAEAVGIQSLAVHLFANAGRKEIHMAAIWMTAKAANPAMRRLPLEVISSGGS